MSVEVEVKPMTEAFLLWRCLHDGPLSSETIDQFTSSGDASPERYRERNIPLLENLTRTYEACAMLAWAGDLVVGFLYFFPKSVLDEKSAGGMCLMMDHPAGPLEDFFKRPLPTIDKIRDKTLVINCMMTGSPLQEENPFQRKGLGTRMVESLILWAREKGWHHIEVEAFEDLPIVYEITGSAGITFWEKLGFAVVDRHPHPHLKGHDEFVETLEAQARDLGISPERARDRIIMRIDLQP